MFGLELDLTKIVKLVGLIIQRHFRTLLGVAVSQITLGITNTVSILCEVDNKICVETYFSYIYDTRMIENELFLGGGDGRTAKWNDDSCGTTRPFVCSMPKSSQYTESQPPNPKNCPKGYQPLGPSCFKLYSDKRSYADAKSQCASDKTGGFGYAGLATVLDMNENEYLKAVMNENTQTSSGPDTPMPTAAPSWIGLYFDKSLDKPGTVGTKWYWEDKRPVSFTAWASGFPEQTAQETGCARIRTNGEWETTASCAAVSPFICKLEADYKAEDHDDPGEDKCDPDWLGYKGNCFYFESGWNTFDDSNDKCKAQGADLASIHDDDERRFLAAVDHGDQWIGLRRDGSGGFSKWSDGTALDYQVRNLNPQGPNRYLNLSVKSSFR